jgi:hypothetical protein
VTKGVSEKRWHAAAVLAAVALLLLGGCRRGGEIQVETTPRIEPYPGFFQAQLADEVFLFASLDEKLSFDREPASLTYDQFISRTGQRIFISNADPALVQRIQVAYERALDTELMNIDSPGAPPPDAPPPPVTRQAVPREPVEPATVPATATTTAPATRPSTVPTDRLGPTGDPPPRSD